MGLHVLLLLVWDLTEDFFVFAGQQFHDDPKVLVDLALPEDFLLLQQVLKTKDHVLHLGNEADVDLDNGVGDVKVKPLDGLGLDLAVVLLGRQEIDLQVRLLTCLLLEI